MAAVIPAGQAIAAVAAELAELPCFIAGSSVSAHFNVNVSDLAYDDVDVFCATPEALVAAVITFRKLKWDFDGNSDRVFYRYLAFGIKDWHTNSIKLRDPVTFTKLNLVYKTVEKIPTRSLAAVIESFDFGLLHTGWDCSAGSWKDLSDFLFPGLPKYGPLPLMPNKRGNWRNGFISQYNGLREVGRYAKYIGYGYDLSAVKDDLITGYREAELYMSQRTDSAEKLQLGLIYGSIAFHMEEDNIDKLAEAGAEILFLDDLDKIMESLE